MRSAHPGTGVLLQASLPMGLTILNIMAHKVIRSGQHFRITTTVALSAITSRV